MVRQPPPISLRIRSIEANANARRLLRKLDEADRLERRVKFLSIRSVVSLREMRTIAGPRLRTMLPTDRDRWLADCKTVEAILLRISQRGVR
jgi:hypothetical protein